MQIKHLLVTAVSGCLIVSCNRAPSPPQPGDTPLPSNVVARIEGHSIMADDFAWELEHRARRRNGNFAQIEQRQTVLREMVNFECFYLRALEAGFHQRPEVVRQIKTFIVDRFREEQLKQQPELPTISDAEVESYYRNHADRFANPEKARFAVIQLTFSSKATEEKQAEVFQKAESVLAEARTLDGTERAFGALAQRYSEDQATRYLGGDAGWLSRGEQGRWDKAVIDAAFALTRAGDLSPIIKTKTGCYLVRLTQRMEASQRPLAEVADAIRYQLAIGRRHRAQQKLQEAMTAGLKIEINRPLLEAIPSPAPVSQKVPPALPGS